MASVPTSPSPQDSVALRRRLGERFEVLGELGSGSSGTVFHARTLVPIGELGAGSEVALKVLRPELAADPSARDRLRAEAALGRSISDPHVVAIHDFGEIDDGAGGRIAYLISEFVHGRTIRDLLDRSGPAVGDLARRIGEQAALGLAALHEAGIVHRDVKPENLLITDDGAEIRLADLGLAKPGGSGSGELRAASFEGSLAYAAPEVLIGRPATPQSDLYALGLVLHEVVTGRHPFAGLRGDAMLHAHLHTPPPRPSHLQPQVSAFFDAIIGELLEKDTTRRPADARAIALVLAEGEASAFWRVRERMAPVLASRRRLQQMRRSRHTAFVDRAIEQQMLDALLAAVLAGEGHAVLVRGHAGSGRRRLLDECVDRWLGEHAGLVFLGGIADDDPTARIGTPFPQIVVDALLDGDDESSPRAVERLQARAEQISGFDAQDARHLAEICAGDPSRLELAPAARADLLVRAIEHLASRARGVVLRIDRSEELASTGLLVVQRLAERLRSSPSLLVLVGPANATGLPGFTELSVGGLDREAFAEFGRGLFRAGEDERGLIDRAWSAFSGQPRALLDSLEELALERRLGGRPGDFFGLDRAVRELRPARPALQNLRDRVAAMPAASRHVLHAAAVLGDRFEVPDLAALTGRPELEVLESLAAFDHRIVSVERGHGRFRHRAYRLATIASTPAESSRRLHRDAAWVLEDRGALPLEIGLHLSKASEHQACIDPLLEGLETLVRANARKQAARIVERLHLHLNRVPRLGPNLERRLRWLLASGDLWLLVDHEEKCSRAFRKAISIARYLGRDLERSRAMVGLADLAQHKGRFLSAIQLLSEAAAVLAGDRSEAARLVRARALLVQARVMATQGQSLAALRLTSEALRVLPPGHAALETHLRIDHARWLALRLRFGRALSSLDRADALLVEHGDPLAEQRIHLHRGRMLATLGDLEAAEIDLERAHELAVRLGDERMAGRSRLARGEVHAYVGEHQAARPFLLEARRAAERAGDRLTAGVADALTMLGEPLEAGTDVVPLQGIPTADLAWLIAEGSRRARAGDRRTAKALLREATLLERSTRVPLELRLMLLRATGRDDAAERLVRAVAARQPAGSPRRRFLSYANRVRV